jgi:anti-sigma factor ChrR (cupin superfamily)
MTSKDSIDTLAALYAAGALPDDERDAVDRRLREGDEALAAAIASYDGVVAGFARECTPRTPDPTIKGTLLAQLDDIVQEAAQPLAQVLTASRASEAEWVPLEVEGVLIDGASIRILSLDAAGGRVTTLLKLEPGGGFPAHVHDQVEECYVMEGEMHCGDEVFRAGDFFRAEPGSYHATHFSPTGCICLVTTSLSNTYPE